LEQHYPGLNLHRFLMEVQDLINKKLNNHITDLEMASYSLSPKAINEMSELFLKGVPFAYLLGKAEFYNHEFYVNHNVLIPRPETEYLVDMIVQEHARKVNRVLDVGTGSGVILLSLLSHDVGKTGVGVDISPEALDVAKINTQRLKLEKKTTLLKSDRLSAVEGMFDLIVSNPPYIKASSHKSLVHQSVDEHEPHQALYLPDDYYVFWFEDFFQEIRGHLKGTFYMEGHELEVEEQAGMLSRLGFQNIKVLPDLTGTKRYLKASIQ
jgi:release factor glutamine methyltransferase